MAFYWKCPECGDQIPMNKDGHYCWRVGIAVKRSDGYLVEGPPKPINGTIHEQVKQFMEFVPSQKTPSKPTVPDIDTVNLRESLIAEEFEEYKLAVKNLIAADTEEDKIKAWSEVADAIGDLHYVVAGASVAFGLPMNPIQNAIHEANMRKFGPGHSIRDDGKLVKPEDWTPPDIESIIEKALRKQ